MKFFLAAVLMLCRISMASAENLLIVGEDEIRQAIEKEFVEQGQNQAPPDIRPLSQRRNRAEHLVGSLNDFRVHLISALRRDQLGNFGHRIDVRSFQIALQNRTERFGVRIVNNRRAGSFGLQKQVLSHGFQSGLVRKRRQFQLSDVGFIGFAVLLNPNLARIVDINLNRVGE